MTQLLLNALNNEVVTKIAQACHEANRRLCAEQLNDFTQLAWKDAPEWQKKSAIDGVRFAMQNNYPTGEALHENWLKEKERDGWTYGEVKDPVAKTHPCMVPYEELPSEQQFKDWLFRCTIISILSLWSGSLHMGPQVPQPKYEPAPEPEPEPTPEPDTPAEPQEDVTIIDGSDGEVDPNESSEAPTGEDTSTEETPEESSKPKRAKKK